MYLMVCDFIAVKMDTVPTNVLIEMSQERRQSKEAQVKVLKDALIAERPVTDLRNVGIAK